MSTAKLLFSLVLVLQVALSTACTSRVPATVTMAPAAPLQTDPKIFLMAASQHERIAQSLRDAGLDGVGTWNEADYTLQVNIGNSRLTQACGTLHNVAYVLAHQGARVMIIKGRGLTGSCDPNVFDDMSRKLASFLAATGE